MENLRAPLRRWFAKHARSFPWREDRTPYRVWISETMLQQTRASTVVPYFLRWTERFPTVESLAAADGQEVMAYWEGLGYYRRAHALHAAARQLVGACGGRFPSNEAGWRALPGVGPYTAAAIAAFALDQPVVAVDANVRRVGARLLGDPAPDDRHLRDALRPLLTSEAPGRSSEALIELGATVCTPRQPRCNACPLMTGCRAAREGRPRDYPAAAGRRTVPTRERWGFPQREAAPEGEPLAPLVQRYTHLRLRLTPVVVSTEPPLNGEGRTRPLVAAARPGADACWASSSDLAVLPLSKVDRRLLGLLRDAGLLASPP